MDTRCILVCTFACCPPGSPGFRGGEDTLGWNLLVQVARFYEVWALTHESDRNSIEPFLNRNSINNVHMVYVSLPRFLRPLLKIQGGHQFYYHLWQLMAYFRAQKLAKQINFELFHHITYANDWLASFIGALLAVPYIRGPGGGAHRTPKGFEGEYSSTGRIWEAIRNIGQWIFRHDPFFIKGQKRASAILLCNSASMNNLPVSHQRKAHLFPVSGVSSENLSLIKKPRTGSSFQVLTVGSLIRVKGFSLAIKAFNQFRISHPNAFFTIVGSGPEESRLRDLVNRLGLQDNVHFTGALAHEKVLKLMVQCDAFLFPSLRDGGGTVVVEAMSAGSPIVCLDTGGPGTYVSESCGIKITPITPEQAVHDLAEALKILAENKDLRDKLGQAGRKKAEHLYHWNHLGDRLNSIYEDVLG